MAPIHHKDIEDLIADLGRQVAALQSSRALGPILASYTSATLPANPPTGLEVYVSDYGLRAWWNGTSWVYPPQLITKKVLTAPSSTVTLPAVGSIPQVFTNLRLVLSAKSDGSGASGYDPAGIQFNGVTGASYNWSTWWVTQGGASVSTTGGTASTNAQCAEVWNSFFTSPGGRGIATIDIPNYADTGTRKSFTSQSTATDGGAAGILQTYGGCLSGTSAAITSIRVLMGAGSFVAGSEFSLHGS
jgi:hypothetical protein